MFCFSFHSFAIYLRVDEHHGSSYVTTSCREVGRGGEAELQTPDVLLRNDFGSGDDPKLRSSSWCTGQAWEIKEPEQHNGLESLASIEKTRSLLRQAAFLWSCCQNCTWTLNSLKAFISLKSPRINRLSLFCLLYFLVSPAEYTFCPYTSCDTLHS